MALNEDKLCMWSKQNSLWSLREAKGELYCIFAGKLCLFKTHHQKNKPLLRDRSFYSLKLTMWFGCLNQPASESKCYEVFQLGAEQEENSALTDDIQQLKRVNIWFGTVSQRTESCPPSAAGWDGPVGLTSLVFPAHKISVVTSQPGCTYMNMRADMWTHVSAAWAKLQLFLYRKTHIERNIIQGPIGLFLSEIHERLERLNFKFYLRFWIGHFWKCVATQDFP